MVIDWFDFSLWLFALIVGIILLILSRNKSFWVKERTSMTEEKIKRMEKSCATGFIVLAVLNLLRILSNH